MRLLAVLLLLLTGIAPAAADAPPSKGAKTMPGAMGTFSFQPKDWKKGQTSY